MRISDWSSDVCSSDLCGRPSHHMVAAEQGLLLFQREAEMVGDMARRMQRSDGPAVANQARAILQQVIGTEIVIAAFQIGRASCREECVSTCRSRWSRYL